MAPPVQPLAQRFERWSAPVADSGCLIWLGKWDWAGYGHMRHSGRDRKAATVAYEMANGPVPKGMEVSHRCGVRACVNPDHLIAETHGENLKRRREFDHRTWGGFCKRGHLLPPREQRNKGGSCPICYADYQAKWKADNADYDAEYRAANKDRINATRRLRRSRTHRE